MTRAACKTPIPLCPLDYAPVSGSNQVSNNFHWKIYRTGLTRPHMENLSLFANFKTHKPSQVCEDENYHGSRTLQDKDVYFVINVVGFCGLFLVTDAICYTRLTAIIPAIPQIQKRASLGCCQSSCDIFH